MCSVLVCRMILSLAPQDQQPGEKIKDLAMTRLVLRSGVHEFCPWIGGFSDATDL